MKITQSYYPHIHFGTTTRFYKDDNNDEVGTNSWLLRNDIDWQKLVAFELENFKTKDKVNVIQFAASDGSEAFTKLIAMEEHGSNEFEKFYPFQAYDIDYEITKAARSGLINCIPNDYKRFEEAGIEFKKYFWECIGNLNIKNDNMYTIYNVPRTTFQVNPKIHNRVVFHNDDMLDIVKQIKDDSNTIVMARNVMLYMQENDIEKFTTILSERLKPGSLFILGSLDTDNSHILKYLDNGGFKEVMPFVFRKEKPLNTNKSSQNSKLN